MLHEPMLHSHLTSSQLHSYTQAVLTVKMSTHYPPIFQLSQILQKKKKNQLSCYLYSEATTDEHTHYVLILKVLLKALLCDGHWYKHSFGTVFKLEL